MVMCRPCIEVALKTNVNEESVEKVVLDQEILKAPTLEFAIIINVRQPKIEKPGSYCFIGGGPPNFKLPLPIE
jgi:hypothetical protein